MSKPRIMLAFRVVLNVALAILLIWFLAAHGQKIRTSIAADRDTTAYWAAGKLLIHRQNPYSVPSVLALQRSQGYTSDKPLMLRPPPWSVWTVLPLGLLPSAYWAWAAWLAVLMTSLVISIRISWRMYGGGPRPPNLFLLASYLFAPVVACLVAAQMGILLMLGITLFLLLEEDRPFLAGTALLLPLAKPHIFVLLWPILALWIVMRKRWTLLGGGATAFLAANSIALVLDPGIFQHYREMLQQQAIQDEFIPSLSGMIRVLFFRRFFWVQFVPMGLGLFWSVIFYWRNRRAWKWRQHGPALLIVSLFTTPYSWMSDEAVLLPAVLQGLLWVNRRQLKLRSQFVILVFVCLDLLLLLILWAQVPHYTGIYFWSNLVWFSWYWYAKSFSQDDLAS